MLRVATGTPMRMIALANIWLAEAEPEPLILAKRTTKSFTLWIDMTPPHAAIESRISACPRRRSGSARRKAAVEADVLVLDHDPPGLETVGDVEVLRRDWRGRIEPGAQSASSPPAVKVMQSIGQMSTQASHSMQSGVGEDRLHVAVEAALRLVTAPSSRRSPVRPRP
jgi:hypothetical protein